jgi:thioredoxin 1
MAGANVKTATDDNFETEILNSQTPALVDFWAVWCGPCRALAPVIDELANDNEGKLNVFKLNVDDNPNIAAKYGVRGIPTILLFKNGQVVEQQVGVVPKADLQKLINRTTA